MGDMKRFALALGVLGVVCFSAFASGTAQAQVQPRPQPSYPPGSTLTLVADPDEVAPNGTFDAVLTGCFPGETVTFYNLWPSQTAQDICDATTYTASVPFNATTTTGTRYIVAYIPALNSPDPEVPDFPPRFLVATYQVRGQPRPHRHAGRRRWGNGIFDGVDVEFGRFVAELRCVVGDCQDLPRPPGADRRDLLRAVLAASSRGRRAEPGVRRQRDTTSGPVHTFARLTASPPRGRRAHWRGDAQRLRFGDDTCGERGRARCWRRPARVRLLGKRRRPSDDGCLHLGRHDHRTTDHHLEHHHRSPHDHRRPRHRPRRRSRSRLPRSDRLGREASQDPFNADKEAAALDRRLGVVRENFAAKLADYRTRNYAIRPNPDDAGLA